MAISITPKTAAKYLIGRTIASVDVNLVEDYDHHSSWNVSSIALDDGSLICFNVEETDFDDYIISASRLPKGTVRAAEDCVKADLTSHPAGYGAVYVLTRAETRGRSFILSIWSSIKLAKSAAETERRRLKLEWSCDDWEGDPDVDRAIYRLAEDGGLEELVFAVHVRELDQ